MFTFSAAQWSEWSMFSTCSAWCGGGVKIRTRQCNSPVSSERSLPCAGVTTEVLPCNTDHCGTILPNILKSFFLIMKKCNNNRLQNIGKVNKSNALSLEINVLCG